MSENLPDNSEIADVLDKIADLLEAKDDNRFKIQAYRQAADMVSRTDKNIAQIAKDKGDDALQQLPHIGEVIACVIMSYVKTGRSEILENLQGDVSPSDLFKKVPGIGETLAHRIAKELDVSSLQELEQAAYDGRLEKVEGIGKEKAENIKVSLAGMLSTYAQRTWHEDQSAHNAKNQPDVSILLNVDKEYRQKADHGELRKIAPKRFNPEGKAWLPIFKTDEQGWELTALYSNTAQAHDLNKTHDWVVIYYQKDSIDDQATVVSETHGPIEGKRVVRGREKECMDYYKNS